MKKILIVISILFVIFPAVVVNAQTTDEYKTELVNYLTVSGTLSSLDATFDQVLMMMGSGLSNLQRGGIKTKATERLIELMTPVYKQYINVEDLKAANAFYSTPAGKRISAAQPLMIKETTQVSMQWATELQGMIQDASK